ncbi:hypothetical protein VSR82_21295 [Burkholderia sp. JPY481]|uniref:hypothetical protein n=1 Tax=Paraburkholderia sp. JPY465 TaxID=3042285 RepID=UPI003177F32B
MNVKTTFNFSQTIVANAIVCGMCVPTLVSAQGIPKQGSFEATYYGVGSVTKSMPMEGDDAVMFFEDTILVPSNPSVPLFQSVSAKCITVGYSKGASNGYCIYTDKDGDKFVESIVKPGPRAAGKGTLASGTGKYKGLEGQLDWELVAFLPADKGSYNYIGKKTGHYRIP